MDRREAAPEAHEKKNSKDSKIFRIYLECFKKGYWGSKELQFSQNERHEFVKMTRERELRYSPNNTCTIGGLNPSIWVITNGLGPLSHRLSHLPASRTSGPLNTINSPALTDNTSTTYLHVALTKPYTCCCYLLYTPIQLASNTNAKKLSSQLHPFTALYGLVCSGVEPFNSAWLVALP